MKRHTVWNIKIAVLWGGFWGKKSGNVDFPDGDMIAQVKVDIANISVSQALGLDSTYSYL